MIGPGIIWVFIPGPGELKRPHGNRPGAFICQNFGRSGRIRTRGHWFWSSAVLVLFFPIRYDFRTRCLGGDDQFVSIVPCCPCRSLRVCRQFGRQFGLTPKGLARAPVGTTPTLRQVGGPKYERVSGVLENIWSKKGTLLVPS